MKIKVYEVPVTLKRTASGVEATLHEDKKVFIREESPETSDPNMIPNIAKKLGDANNTQMTLVKGTMLGKEQESTAKVIFKYLG
jgi:hypothetical protein